MSSALTPPALSWSAATKAHLSDSVAMFRCLVIALVVGTILTVINLGVALSDGRMSVGIALALVVNYSMPFIVSSLGAIATRRGRTAREAKGQADPP